MIVAMHNVTPITYRVCVCVCVCVYVCVCLCACVYLCCTVDGTSLHFEAGEMKALEMVTAINKKARDT